MSIALDGAVVVALALWLVLSVLNQFSAIEKIKRRDAFSLIPRWTFFAPNPANTDYELLYRDRLRDGGVTEWRTALVASEKKLRVAVWNPGKRRQKAVSDFMRSLNRNRRGSNNDSQALQLSLAYITLLHVAASTTRHEPDAELTQFAILQTYGFLPRRNPRLIMHSRFHALT